MNCRSFLGYCLTFSALFFAFALPTEAATTTGMPWETPMNNFLNSLTGPVVRVAGAMAIVFFGISLAFSEGGGIVRKGLWILMGLTIAFNAVSWGLGFFGFSAGALI